MPQVNGFQNPGLALARPAGGLSGFQQQGMDQRKKSSGADTGLVGVATYATTGGGAMAYPVRPQEGDLVVAVVTYGDGVTSPLPASWFWEHRTIYDPSQQIDFCSKVLTPGELNFPPTFAGAGNAVILQYRGQKSARIAAYTTNPTHVGTVAVAGFTPRPAALAFTVACGLDAYTPPQASAAGWDYRARAAVLGVYPIHMATKPASDGAAFSWLNVNNGSSFGECAVVVEVF